MKVYEYDKYSGVYSGTVDLPEGMSIPNSLSIAPTQDDCFYSAGEWVVPTEVVITAAHVTDKRTRDAKSAKKNEIKQRMERELAQGFTCSNSITMDATAQDIAKLQSFGYDMAVTGNKPTLDIRDHANKTHRAVLLADVKQMLKELRDNYSATWKAKNTSLELLNKATTVKKINAL